MNKEQTNVKQFMQTFGQECPDKPTIPSLEVRKLRAKLILEEALETIEALGLCVMLYPIDKSGWMVGEQQGGQPYDIVEGPAPNLLQIADGLADLDYVSKGTAIACGLDMEPIHEEVHRSNMSKLWNSEEVNNAPLAFKEKHQLHLANYHSETRKWKVVDLNGKIIKSPSYSPVNLQPIIAEQSCEFNVGDIVECIDEITHKVLGTAKIYDTTGGNILLGYHFTLPEIPTKFKLRKVDTV